MHKFRKGGGVVMSSDSERQRREAERRARIYRAIAAKKSQVSNLSSKKSVLQGEMNRLGGYVNDWNTSKNSFNGDELTKKVVLKEVFEGKAADSLRAKKEAMISTMDNKIAATASIKSRLSGQISRVQAKIESLNSEISSLYAQL